MKVKPLWVSAAVIAAGLLWAGLSGRQAPLPFRRFPGGNLLAYATPVVPKANVPFSEGYQWTSRGNLYVTAEGDYRGKRMLDTGPLPTLVDGRTGKYAPMTKFLDAADGKPAFTHPLNFQNGHCVSPDGRWLIFATHRANRAVWQVTASDGSRRLFWPRPESQTETNHAVWTVDSRQWLEAVPAKDGWRFLVHNINTSRSTAFSIVWPDTAAPNHFDPTRLLGFSHDGVLIARASEDAADVFFRFTFIGNQVFAHPYRVNLPPQAVVSDVVLGSQSDRLAWSLQFDHRSWWDRHFPSLLTSSEPPSDTMGLCTSRPDGTDMREIAPEYSLSGPPGTSKPVPYNLRWTPDGRSVSFSLGNALYMVSDR